MSLIGLYLFFFKDVINDRYYIYQWEDYPYTHFKRYVLEPRISWISYPSESQLDEDYRVRNMETRTWFIRRNSVARALQEAPALFQGWVVEHSLSRVLSYRETCVPALTDRTEWLGAWCNLKQTTMAVPAGKGLHLGTIDPSFWWEGEGQDSRVQLWNPWLEYCPGDPRCWESSWNQKLIGMRRAWWRRLCPWQSYMYSILGEGL